MQIIDIDGNEINWVVKGRITNTEIKNISKLHLRARKVLKKVCYSLSILEEVPIPVSTHQILYLDFFIPSMLIAVEVQGSQHYSFNRFFHKNKLKFLKHQRNDRTKIEWCKLNNIILIEFPYNETDEQWYNKIT